MYPFLPDNFQGLKKSPFVLALSCLLLSFIATASFASELKKQRSQDQVLILTQFDQPLDQEWEHQKFVNETKYVLVSNEGKRAIRAVGQQSSSGLYKKIEYAINDYPWIEWEWKLETVHRTADLRIKEKEDMALGLFVIFSRSWLPPWKTKAIAYVWASDIHQPGQLIMRSHHPYFVLEAGEEKKGRWIIERRNLYEDYKRAYGQYPKKHVKAISLYTDNDQTKEPVVGYYGPIRALKKLR